MRPCRADAAVRSRLLGKKPGGGLGCAAPTNEKYSVLFLAESKEGAGVFALCLVRGKGIPDIPPR